RTNFRPVQALSAFLLILQAAVLRRDLFQCDGAEIRSKEHGRFLRGELEDFLRQTLGRDLTAAALFDLAATKARNGYPPKMGVCTSGSLLKIGWIIALRRDRCGPGEVGIIFTIINLKSITEKLQNCIPPGGRWLLPTFCKSHTMTPCVNSA